jgi:hypothetical protein
MLQLDQAPFRADQWLSKAWDSKQNSGPVTRQSGGYAAVLQKSTLMWKETLSTIGSP